MKNRLIMTLLVRDEEDILERNICFHLNQGVDFIVAIDNGSTDQTPKILQKYEEKGVLSFHTVPEHTFEQSKWVSSMAKRAVDVYGATHLFHCDADEFWVPKNGDLKKHLPKKNEIFKVGLVNYLPNPNTISFFKEKHFAVIHPYQRISRYKMDSSYRYFLNKHEQKVFTSAEYTDVSQGNHFILSEDHGWRDIDDVVIHHFPVRTLEQFRHKVINGGSSYTKNPQKIPDIGWQWKEWYFLEKSGMIGHVFQEICLHPQERTILEKLGVIQKRDIPQEIVKAISLYKKNEHQL